MPLPTAAAAQTSVTIFFHHKKEEGTSAMATHISSAEEQRLFLAQLAERYFEERHRKFQQGLLSLLEGKSGQFAPAMVDDAWFEFCEEEHGTITHTDILWVAATIAALYTYLNKMIIATQSQVLQSAKPLTEDSDPTQVYAPINVGDHMINNFLRALRNSFHRQGVSYPNLKLSFCIAETLAQSIDNQLTKKMQDVSIYTIGYPKILDHTDVANHLTELLELVKKAGSANALSRAGQLFIDLLGSAKSLPAFTALRDHFETEYKNSAAAQQLGAHARFGWLYFLSSYLICAAQARDEFKNEKEFDEHFDFTATKASFEKEWIILSQPENRFSPVCWKEQLEEQYQQFAECDLRQITNQCYSPPAHLL